MEIHRYAAENFSKVFNQVKYKFILGLTGTIKRLDSKHTLLTTYCPIIDTITTKEAKDNDWIAKYMEFNLAVEMSEDDKKKYKKMDESFDQYMNVFQWDFSMMMKCAKSYKPVLVKGGHADSACVTLAKEYGWTGFNADIAFDNLLAKKADIWGNLAHIYNPKSLFIRGINGMKTLRKMKSFVQNYQKKIDTAIEICQKVPVKTITFGESTVSADKITAALPLVSVSYHSKVAPMVSLLGKKLNRKETLKFLIDEIKAGRYTQVNTAKALDEGADLPEMQMGIRVSGTSASAQHKQRRGRITRKHGDKRAVMINLYVKGTKDEQWLTKSQGRDHGIIWVDTVEEIIELLDL